MKPVIHFPCRIKAAILLAFVLYTFPAFCGETRVDLLEQRIQSGPHLSDILAHAYETSPMIHSSRAAWQESLERYRVDTAYPDPELVVTYWPKSMADNLDLQKYEVMLSQTIPFPGKLTAMGEAAKAEAAVNRLDLDRSVREVMTSIRESFHELFYIREAIRIAKNNQALLSEIQTLSETAYAANRSALIDVMKAKSQAAQNGYDELLLTELEHTEITRLNALTNRDRNSAIGPLIPEPYLPVLFSLDEIFTLTEKNREEIRMAGQEVKKADAGVRVAGFENLPEFKLGILYEEELEQSMGETMRNENYGVQLGMTLPFNLDKNSGRSGAARAAREKAKAREIIQVNEARTLVRESYFRLQNAQRLVTLYRDKLVPEAEKSVETARVWNRQGQGSITDYLEIQSVHYNFELALARARADYGRYLARLEGLAGQNLTRKDEAIPVQKKEQQP